MKTLGAVDNAGVIIAIVFGCFWFIFFIIIIISVIRKVLDVKVITEEKAKQRSLAAKEVNSSLKDKKQSSAIKVAKEQAYKHLASKVVSKEDDHYHLSDEEEYYDEIVGSLGEINDEGCSELNGVRLISHDISYEFQDIDQDYTDLAKAIVMGEILNNPRFKNNYKH